jgi:hypothetical protein
VLSFVAEPPEELIIYDERRNEVSGVIGPLMEGNDLQLACEVKGGKLARKSVNVHTKMLNFQNSFVLLPLFKFQSCK